MKKIRILDPNKDGIEHINIYSQGKTHLGRMLSNFYRHPINTPDGKFLSVEGYWYWLGIEDCKEKEVLRNLYGYNAKKTGNELKKKFEFRNDVEFEKKIKNAIWQKFKNNEHLLTENLQTLPLEHYYNFGGKVVDVKEKYLWMIDGIEKMRSHIINERIGE